MSIDIHFTSEDWARIERDWGAFWAGELDRPMVMIEQTHVPEGVVLPEAPGFVPQLPMDMPVDDVVDRYEAHLPYRRCYGDAFPKWFVNFGAGVVAAFLGAKIGVTPETVWFEPETIQELAEIHLQLDEANPCYQRALDISRRAAQRWGKQVCVSYPDIGGNLDVLASLRTTERLLMDTMDCPDEIERLAGEITALWLEYFEKFHAATDAGQGHASWGPIWSPGRTYMLQCDFCYMISPAMFERYVVPDLTACCEHLDHSFYHLDGKGALAHLDLLLAIEKLHGVQWIPGDGQPTAAHWPEVLGKIRAAGKFCQVYGPADDMLKIVREHGGKGFVLYLTEESFSDAGGIREDRIQDFLVELQRQGRV